MRHAERESHAAERLRVLERFEHAAFDVSGHVEDSGRPSEQVTLSL